MKKEVKLPSVYGPVEITLIVCDGPDCSNCNQEEHMVGWLKVSAQGISAPTMGGKPDDMDFCSLDCLGRAVDAMLGRD